MGYHAACFHTSTERLNAACTRGLRTFSLPARCFPNTILAWVPSLTVYDASEQVAAGHGAHADVLARVLTSALRLSERWNTP